MDDWLATGLTGVLGFCRMGALIMSLPGFADNAVSPRFRLTIALLISLAMAPVVNPVAMPDHVAALLGLIAIELLVGVAIGMSVRLVAMALNTAGQIIALQTGLAFASTVDPNYGGQSTEVARFLSMLGLVMFFALNLHHAALGAVWASYEQFPAGVALPLGDLAAFAIDLTGQSFALGLQLAAPALFIGFALNVGIGLVNRVVPQMQLFFVAMPLGVVLIIAALGLTLGLGLYTWAEVIDDRLRAWG